MLTTEDIQIILWKYPGFRGVYPISDLPNFLLPKPSSLIVNLDERWKPGSHWVAVYFPKIGPAYYFDSYGRFPASNIIALLELNSRGNWIYNDKKLQGDLSTLCGLYCIEFIRSCPNYNRFFREYDHCNPDNDKKLLKRFQTSINTRMT